MTAPTRILRRVSSERWRFLSAARPPAGDLLLLEGLRLLQASFQIGDPILDTGHEFTSSKRMVGILAQACRPIRPVSDPGTWSCGMDPHPSPVS